VKKQASQADAGGAEPASASVEDCIKRLGEIVEKLESGELPLEDSVRLFEEGVKLARSSQARLDAAERRVEELLGVDAAGEPIVREHESE
jgi:exodeoxyribonuclease VII small subunit